MAKTFSTRNADDTIRELIGVWNEFDVTVIRYEDASGDYRIRLRDVYSPQPTVEVSYDDGVFVYSGSTAVDPDETLESVLDRIEYEAAN